MINKKIFSKKHKKLTITCLFSGGSSARFQRAERTLSNCCLCCEERAIGSKTFTPSRSFKEILTAVRTRGGTITDKCWEMVGSELYETFWIKPA